MRWITFLIVLAAAPAGAQDTSATMAALKDEKSECRYLLSLCDEVVELSASGPADPALRKLRKLTEAAEVLKAKHEKPPACLATCDARLRTATRK